MGADAVVSRHLIGADDFGPMILAVGLFILGVFLAGGVLGWVGHSALKGRGTPPLAGERSKPPSLSVLTVSQTQLRCQNGPEPRVYTREELESRYNVGKMYLQTAESAGLWTTRGQQAARIATGVLIEVLVCSDVERR